MLSHKEFLPALAEVLGESLNTIKLVHRLLREDNHLEGRRGRHAPHRSPRDAAAFLCWLGVTDKPSLAPQVYHDFGLSGLINYSKEALKPFGSDHPLFALNLPAEHTFVDMLDALISAEVVGIDARFDYTIDFAADELNIAIDFGAHRALYGRENDPDEAIYWQRYGRPYRVVRTFPRALIRNVASLFSAESEQRSANGLRDVEAA